MSASRVRCEVCGAAAAPPGVTLEVRVVALCSEHKRQARAARVRSLDALRALFVEATGRRALVPRRAPAERRLFPPRPEGRRQAPGRRTTDGS